MNILLNITKPLCTAALLAATCLAAQATTVAYTGIVDSGPLNGSSFSGSFSYVEPTASFDGSVDLDSFTLAFAGQTYTLASADLTPVAWFASGSFIGIDYLDLDSAPPAVAFLAGFNDLSQALFSYDVPGAGQGFGGFTSLTTVPEPATTLLLLAGLGLIAGTSGSTAWRTCPAKKFRSTRATAHPRW